MRTKTHFGRIVLAVALVATMGGLSPSPAATSCDTTPGSDDQIALQSAYAAIDVECPCDDFTSRGDYRSCVRAIVESLIDGDSLQAGCERNARAYGYQSRCGREGAVVCCRIDTGNGRQKHRVLRDASRCVSTSRLQQCLSETKSAVTGCDATGCISFCGNSIVDGDEQCDPPDGSTCDDSCRYRCGNGVVDSGEGCDPPNTANCDEICRPICGDGVVTAPESCEPPGTADCDLGCQACESDIPATCGNLVIDAGETCEPPAIGSCTLACQTATCQPAIGAEINVACVAGNVETAAAGSPSGYLLAWTGGYRRSTREILARRFDANGAAVDPSVTVVSEQQTCGTASSSPAAACEGAGCYVLWAGIAPYPNIPGLYRESLSGRRVGATSGAQSTDLLAQNTPVGTCRGSIGGPTAASGAGATRFAVSWRASGSCLGSPVFREPVGAFLDFNPDLVRTNAPIGYPLPTGYPGVASTDVATVASLSGATLWSWHAGGAYSPTGPFLNFVASAWSDGTTTGSPFALSAKQATASGARPSVSAGAASFLVAWADGTTFGTPTDVRAVRVTRASGRLDPDGGLLLATVPGGIHTAPAAAFDGTRWLVAWTQTAGATNELRAVAVNADGTVVDSSPRLVADNVKATVPVLASAGDGKVLVMFQRDDGSFTGVRGVLVQP